MSIQHVIFDLDGTLIDSSRSILQSFESAFLVTGIQAIRPFTPEIIGPPLIPTLKMLSGLNDEVLLKRLAEAFKAEYDSHAYQLATVFEGVEPMLAQLQAEGKQLYIATNKRILPTHKIMQYLNWSQYFTEVYALDYFTPAVPNKAEMVTRIIAAHQLPITQTAFVGDRVEDGQAASANHLPFAMVTWGYLDTSMGDMPADWQQCTSPSQLLDYLRK